MAIILQGKITGLPMPQTGYPDIVMFCGYALFWTGVSVGISNLVCGYLLLFIFANTCETPQSGKYKCGHQNVNF